MMASFEKDMMMHIRIFCAYGMYVSIYVLSTKEFERKKYGEFARRTDH
jgi:hypothetical protein